MRFACPLKLIPTFWLLLVGAVAAGEEPAERLLIRVGPAGLKGSEEYRLEKTYAGWHLTSRSSLEQVGTSISLLQDQTLTPECTPIRYRLQATVGGQTQVIEAWREADQVRMSVDIAGSSRSKSVPLATQSLLMDNLIGSHYQVLLCRLAARSWADEWSMIVPQARTSRLGVQAMI